MKLFRKAKDGGPKSTVTGYWLIEWKRLFSIVLLRFDDGSRDEFHSHAFNSVNWVLSGEVHEQHLGFEGYDLQHRPSVRPVITRRQYFHRVVSVGTTWVLSFRGPWSKSWDEYDPKTNKFSTLTNGRRIVQGTETR